MKIVYLHQYFRIPRMSGGTRSYEMARRLAAYGHEVHMITSDRSGRASFAWFRTTEAGIHVHWLPVPYANRMPYASRLLAFFRFALQAAVYAARLHADVIFATSTPLTIALPAVYVARARRAPLVFEVRDLWPAVPIALGALKGPLILPARLLERFAYRHSFRVVALSPGIREGIVGTGYPAGRVHIIPNGCDIGMFQAPVPPGASFRKRFEWLGERPLVLYAGTLGRVNGVKYLVRLAAEIRKTAPEIRFLTVGDGNERELVRDLAHELGVLGRSFFMSPPLPKEEMPALLSAATVAVSLFIDMPEMRSNSANKFFDALAAGRPVAVNYKGWQADLIRETGAGLVLPPVDFPAAARQMARAALDRDWVARAGASALRLARERFDRDRLAEQLEGILLEAAARDRGVSA